MISTVRRFSVGDCIVYHKKKTSTQPGPRAADVRPFVHGEGYSYFVDKYWRVTAVHDDNTIEALTRTGKRHLLDANDPHIRRLGPFKRWLLQSRFPSVEEKEEPK